MLAEIEHQPPPGKKRKEAFIERLETYDWETRETIIYAYDIAELAHAGQFRSSGEPYFTHPLATAAILMDECAIQNPDIIIGALLHDTVEDTAIFGEMAKLSSTEWLHIANFRLAKLSFNPQVAEIVVSLTKPKIDGVEVFSEEDRRKIALDKLAQASPEALLVKMADRLHNLRTLNGLDDWKAGMVIAETQQIMYELFSRVLTTYPTEGSILLEKMNDAICAYERSQNY